MKIKNRYKGEVTKADGKKEYFFGATVSETVNLCQSTSFESYQVINRENGWVVASRRPIVHGAVEGEWNPHSLRNMYTQSPAI
jgi:hypothetical protein